MATFCVLTQSCLTLCDLMDYSPPGSCVHGIFLAEVQKYWSTEGNGLPFPSPEDLPNPGIEPWSPELQAGRLFTNWATREVPYLILKNVFPYFLLGQGLHETPHFPEWLVFTPMTMLSVLFVCCWSVSCSVVSDSFRSHGLWPMKFLCPWNFPGKDTGVACHSLLQRIFPTQGLNPGLLHCRQILYHSSHQGSPWLNN